MKKKIRTQSTNKSEPSEIRKDFRKRLLYIGLCTLIVFGLANVKPPSSYVALLFFFLGMIQLVYLVQHSQSIVDDFFPPKNKIEKKANPNNEFLHHFSNWFFFSSAILLLFEIKDIAYTVNGMSLFWKAGFFGILSGIFFLLLIQKISSSVYHHSDRRFTVIAGNLIGFFLITPTSVNFVNHYFAGSIETCNVHRIIKKDTGGKRNRTSWIYLNMNNQEEERIEVDKVFFNEVEVGQEIKLCTKKGRLGYDIVTGYKTTDE